MYIYKMNARATLLGLYYRPQTLTTFLLTDIHDVHRYLNAMLAFGWDKDITNSCRLLRTYWVQIINVLRNKNSCDALSTAEWLICSLNHVIALALFNFDKCYAYYS